MLRTGKFDFGARSLILRTERFDFRAQSFLFEKGIIDPGTQLLLHEGENEENTCKRREYLHMLPSLGEMALTSLAVG
jgi:predicted NAD/FAD-dependent oxidoreductase